MALIQKRNLMSSGLERRGFVALLWIEHICVIHGGRDDLGNAYEYIHRPTLVKGWGEKWTWGGSRYAGKSRNYGYFLTSEML